MASIGTAGDRSRASVPACQESGAAMLDVLFANSRLPIAVINRDFTVLEVNAAYCTAEGRSSDELLGRNHFELQPDAEIERIFRTVMDTGRPFTLVAKPLRRALRPEHGMTYWDWTVAPLQAPDGSVDGVVVTLVDVTEQERVRQASEHTRVILEQQVRDRTTALEDAVRELESFSYCVSHDLSAPLRAINGYASLLSEEFAAQLPENAAGYLERIREASARMDQLMMGLLQLNRVSRSELDRQPVDFATLAREIILDLRTGQPERSVNFACTQPLPACIDRDMAHILLVNLLGNAWKFTAPRRCAEIELGLKTCCGERIYYVRDNGVGFDMQFADKLYDAFERLHGREFPGAGIGLATVARMVRSHGGRIWAHAEEDEGATFCFTLGDADSAAHKGISCCP